MGKTAIEWTDFSFNPWWGCAKVSPACDFCYAERDAHRYQPKENYWGVDAARRTFGDKHWNEPLKWNRAAELAGKPARVFCASMADVFDKNAPEGARESLWALIRGTPYLRWLLLTKRIGNAPSMLPSDWDRGYPNVWLGISVVTQREADRDIPKLREIPASIRFLSCEPLLELVYFRHADLEALDWVIAGGESGPAARPMNPRWARSIRDQCGEAGVPFLFKQWGEWCTPEQMPPGVEWSAHHDYIEDAYVTKVGKKKAGRLLDGRTWDELPHIVQEG